MKHWEIDRPLLTLKIEGTLCQDADGPLELGLSKESGTSVPQLQGTEFSKQPEWAWEQVLLQSLQIEPGLDNT